MVFILGMGFVPLVITGPWIEFERRLGERDLSLPLKITKEVAGQGQSLAGWGRSRGWANRLGQTSCFQWAVSETNTLATLLDGRWKEVFKVTSICYEWMNQLGNWHENVAQFWAGDDTNKNMGTRNHVYIMKGKYWMLTKWELVGSSW